MKNFAGINFHGEALSKDFTGIKKGEILKFVRRNIHFYCTVIKVRHLTCVKIAKKEFQKTDLPLFFLS